MSADLAYEGFVGFTWDHPVLSIPSQWYDRMGWTYEIKGISMGLHGILIIHSVPMV